MSHNLFNLSENENHVQHEFPSSENILIELYPDAKSIKGGSFMSKISKWFTATINKLNQSLKRGWEKVREFFINSKKSRLYSFILDVLNQTIASAVGLVQWLLGDVLYIINTIVNLNPSIRIGIIIALCILGYLYTAPVVVLMKLQRIAGFLMSLLFFVFIFGYVFFMLRSASTIMDVGDTVRDNVKTKNIGFNISEQINSTLGSGTVPVTMIGE